MRYTLAEDTISRSEIEEVTNWMLAGNRLTKGKQTIDFESEFSNYMGCKHSIFVNSGSSANLLAVYANKISGNLRNNIAIAPAVSWVTTVTPLLQLGFETYLCDADPVNLGLDINKFEELCRKHRPSIAILVHVLGHSNNMAEIVEICDRYDVKLIEDSCEALASTYQNKKLGTLGQAGTFSFYYGHHISTIEGGMVVTDDTELANIMTSVRSHGWSRDLPPQLRQNLQRQHNVDDFRNLYSFYWEGYNLRSTDLQAFIGRGQLKQLDEIANVRSSNMLVYMNSLNDYFKQKSSGSFVSNFAYGTLIQNPEETSKFLSKHKIESRPLICGNIARQPFWLEKYEAADLPIADMVHDKGIYLPNHANLKVQEVKEICEVFKQVAIPV
jgi:CDP-6-deoxy-D-xylo-4-hexulose-3-dehydrase